MSNTYFGWELFYSTIEQSLSKKEEVLIAFVHFLLIKHGFRCFGFDSETNPEHQYGSELLPASWNERKNLTLKYKIHEQDFVLQVSKVEGGVVFTLLNPAKVEASSVVFEIESAVRNVKGPLRSIIPNYPEIWSKAEESLLKQIVPENIGKVSVGVQTSKDDDSDKSEPKSVAPPNLRSFAERNPDYEEYFDPLGVGRSDLDPLGHLGGGMLLRPTRRRGFNPGLGVPGGLPRGAVPPGARFDPFGPPDLNRPGRGFGGRLSNPDHDHLPPPGYDDMFM